MACLYLYVLERIARDTPVGNYKIFDYLINFAYGIFVLTAISPILVAFVLLCCKAILTLSHLDETTKKNLAKIASFLLGTVSGIISSITAVIFTRRKKFIKQEQLTYEEISELETANRLFKDGYYSQTIIEIFKILETHIYKILQKKDIRVQRYRFSEMLRYAEGKRLITKEEFQYISSIRVMRNAAAHLDVSHTKEEAIRALNFVKDLIRKN